jgi:hypothetical protein
MKVCRTLDEFYKYNDQDLTNIIIKSFKSVLNQISLEDLKSEIYLRLHQKKYIQGYRPLSVEIVNGTWYIKRADAKFSTYIFTFIRNYIYAYYNKVDPNTTCLSLEDYTDSNYSKEANARLRITEKDNSLDNANLRLHIEKISKHLEKTKLKGNLVGIDKTTSEVIRIVEACDDLGCTEEHIASKILSDKKDITNLEKISVHFLLLNLENKKYIVSKKSNDGTKIYYPGHIERRSLFNLFNYYAKGYMDKEISEKFDMTVAGIGALKRSLREEISTNF